MARRAVEKDDTPKYEPTIYNYKCREDSSSRSPTPSPPAIKEEPVLENFGKDVTVHYTKSPHDGEHSDNCSEVSDEGYRSLGAVQPNGGNGNSGTQGSPTVADCQSKRVFTWFHFYAIFASKSFRSPRRDLWAVKSAWVGTPVTRIPRVVIPLAGSRLRRKFVNGESFFRAMCVGVFDC